MATARRHGLHAERVPTPGVHPAFVTGLVDLVLERLEASAGPGAPAAGNGPAGAGRERAALTALGPWYDVCRAGCCANPRGVQPAVAGLAP
jgi:ferrochelatase